MQLLLLRRRNAIQRYARRLKLPPDLFNPFLSIEFTLPADAVAKQAYTVTHQTPEFPGTGLKKRRNSSARLRSISFPKLTSTVMQLFPPPLSSFDIGSLRAYDIISGS
ncbi:MAG TPA: hypothetical protein VEC99_05940 [Clostridia bacterium]|nr:hypothetical protein [Clostridia bacterium]